MHIDIVGGCQLRCVGCPNSTLRPKATSMAVDDFARCMANVDVERIGRLQLFNFGEPLLHRDLPGIFRVLGGHRDRIDRLEISTNGQFARWDQLEEAISMKLLDRLVVSCDGDGTPESFERLRPPAKWSKLIEFFERAREIRDRRDPNLHLATRTVITDRAHRRRWKSVLKPLGFRPEFRAWKILPESAENPSGRMPEPGQGACLFVEANDLSMSLGMGWRSLAACILVPACSET